MRVAVIQPSYIPWLGYLYMMMNVDLFVYYDNVQYDKNGWRNRNRVLAGEKTKWLTLAIDKSSLPASLKDRSLTKVRLVDHDQFTEHRRLLGIYYKDSPSIHLLDSLYVAQLNQIIGLSDTTIMHTEHIAQTLRIKSTRIRSSTLDWPLKDSPIHENCSVLQWRNSRLLDLLIYVGCTEYISGVSAQSYLDVDLFTRNGISVTWNPFKGDTQNFSVLHYLLTDGLEDVVRSISM